MEVIGIAVIVAMALIIIAVCVWEYSGRFTAKGILAGLGVLALAAALALLAVLKSDIFLLLAGFGMVIGMVIVSLYLLRFWAEGRTKRLLAAPRGRSGAPQRVPSRRACGKLCIGGMAVPVGIAGMGLVLRLTTSYRLAGEVEMARITYSCCAAGATPAKVIDS